MYWTGLVLIGPAATLYSANPLKYHTMGMKWCPKPDPYSDSELASWSLILRCWVLGRAAESQILMSFFFVWRGRGLNHQAFACQANAQPLHYPAAVKVIRKLNLSLNFKLFPELDLSFFRSLASLSLDVVLGVNWNFLCFYVYYTTSTSYTVNSLIFPGINVYISEMKQWSWQLIFMPSCAFFQ